MCVLLCVSLKGVTAASLSATKRQNAHRVRLLVCVCARALRVADESVSESLLATLVFTVPFQLQRPFNLKTSQFESPFAHVASVSPPAK